MAESDFLKRHYAAQHPAALERIRIAMLRLPNVLDREIVANQKTLEQKISDQGPKGQRIDPQLLGLGIRELFLEKKFIKATHHPATSSINWYSNTRTSEVEIAEKLKWLAPLYSKVSTGHFTNFVGDALEVVVHKSLIELGRKDRRFVHFGSFEYTSRDKYGRYIKNNPPPRIGDFGTDKIPDFYLVGFESGPLLIECKNYREWLYPSSSLIKEIIVKSLESRTTPVLVARRIHYTTIRNFLEPAGIIAHETYYQYYMSEFSDLAKEVSHKRSLGFSDVRAQEDPDRRTLRFFCELLPKVALHMADRFNANRLHLEKYASGQINLAQLYNAIGSPAAGNWRENPEIAEVPD